MPFTKLKDIDFKIENNRIILTPEYLKKNLWRFKKITGSRLLNVLGYNPMCSSFKTWCMMVNIYYEEMDEMLANAGNVIEPKIRGWVENKIGKKFTSYDPKSIGFDIFKDNKVFGGIPDGEIINDLDNDISILEIKTTSIDSFEYKKINHIFVLQKDQNNIPIIKSIGTKKQKWYDENNKIKIPNEYLFQLGLYCYLRHKTKGLFAICFLKTEDYVNPEQCNINEREIELVDFQIDLIKFEKYIEMAKEWFYKYIETGISPEMNEEDKLFVKDLLG